jgi:hypothetical protein
LKWEEGHSAPKDGNPVDLWVRYRSGSEAREPACHWSEDAKTWLDQEFSRIARSAEILFWIRVEDPVQAKNRNEGKE